MTNTNLLKSKMIANGDEHFVDCLSRLLGSSRVTASKKLHNKTEFKQSDISIIAAHYGLSAEEIKEIFVQESGGNDSN